MTQFQPCISGFRMSMSAKQSLSRFDELCLKEAVFNKLGSAMHPLDTLEGVKAKAKTHELEMDFSFHGDETLLVIHTNSFSVKKGRMEERFTLPVNLQGRENSDEIGMMVARTFKKFAKQCGNDAQNVELETDPCGFVNFNIDCVK